MLTKVIQFICVAVFVTLVCFLLGAVLPTLKVDIAATVGNFLTKWGSVLGILAGLWYVVSGSPRWPGRGAAQ